MLEVALGAGIHGKQPYLSGSRHNAGEAEGASSTAMNFSGIGSQTCPWLDHFSGPELIAAVTIFTPALQVVFKRTYYYTARNLHCIETFRRDSRNRQASVRCTDVLARGLETALTSTRAALAEALRTITCAGLPFRPLTDARLTYQVHMITALNKAHIQLFKTADLLVLGIDLLAAHQLIGEDERRHRTFLAKWPLREFANQTRAMYTGLRERSL
jgi:hypothetical protein